MTSDRVAPDVPPIAAFRPVPRTGVIFVTTEAEARGYHQGDSTWCNLGQGQPETDLLPGGAERLTNLSITPEHHEYAPVAGLKDLRQAVAEFYNRRFRQGMPSQYTWENVAICGGGRLALARAAVALGEVNLGHFLPDYTAYEELLSVFRLFNPIPILLDPESGYQFPVDELRKEILGRGLSAILLSNPCNPTGRTIAGSELAAWVATARSLDCSLLVDEFYSHYIWKRVDGAAQRIISAAAFVEDVDKDPILLFDGLTKNWRYPGMRVSWTVGPKSVIEAVASAGSFLDGGGTRAAQLASIDLLTDDVTDAETEAIHTAFAKKRTFLLKQLSDMGIKVDLPTEGGFYVWGSVEDLGPGLDDALSFFDAALEQKVITVPGMFFDINPGRRRQDRPSRFGSHLRFSFGPELEKLELATSRLRAMIESR